MITVLFWALMQPLRFGLGQALCCGLLADVLHGTPLGQHGLTLAIAACLVIKPREFLWIFPHWQQALVLLPVLAVYEFVLFWIVGVPGFDAAPVQHWFPVIISALIRPFWSWFLERIAAMDVRETGLPRLELAIPLCIY